MLKAKFCYSIKYFKNILISYLNKWILLFLALLGTAITSNGNNLLPPLFEQTATDTGNISTAAYWEWATVWGGTGDEFRPFIDKGTDGSVFVAGLTEDSVTPVPTTAGVYQDKSLAKNPLFISRFDSTGTLIYSTFVGMGEQNFIRDFQVFGTDAYILYDVSGGTSLSDLKLFDLAASGVGNTQAINNATIIEKIDGAGNLAWSTVIDGNANEIGFEIIVNEGGVWFYTDTYSTDLPTVNAHQASNAGQSDHYVGRLNLEGKPIFATYYGGPDADDYNEFGFIGLAAYAEGMAIAGYSNGSNSYPVTHNPVNYPNPDPPNTITAFNGDGTLSYSFLYAQAEDVQPLQAIAMDENGNLYIAVQDGENFMPSTAGAYQENSASTWDIHLASFDRLGNWNWATYLGGTATDRVEYMQYKDGYLFLTGSTSSSDFPTTAQSFPHTGDGFVDVFVAKFLPSGQADYIHLFGGTEEDWVLSFDSENGYASLLINQEEEGFPITSDPLNSIGGDVNVAMRLNQDGSLAYSMPIECSSDFSDDRPNFYNPKNGIVSIGDNICYISFGEDADFPTTEGAYFKDNLNGSDFYVGCIGPIACPPLTAFNTTNSVNPTLVIACQDGTIPGFTGSEMVLETDSLNLKQIYKRGTPVEILEGFQSVKYQWQAYNEISLQWENVAGAITTNFLPPPTSADVTYRRAAFTANATCDTLFSNQVLVQVETSPVAPTLPPDSIYQKCISSTLTIDATATGGIGPYTYTWSPLTGLSAANGCTTFPDCPMMQTNVAASTIYIVEVTDAATCLQTEQYTVNVYEPAANAGPDVASCDGIGVQIGTPDVAPGTSSFSYAWSPNDGSLSCIDCPQPIANPSNTTTYTLTVTGPDGCLVSDMVTVSVVSFTADAGPDSIAVCMGSIQELGAAYTNGYAYTWAPINYIDNALIAQPDYKVGFLPTPNPYQYTLTKTHTTSGCQEVDSIKIFNLLADAGPDGCGPRTVGTADPHGFPVTYDWTIAQVTGGTSADVTVSCTDCPQPFIDYDRTTVQVWMSVCVSYLNTTCCDIVWLPDCLCPFPDPSAISDAACAIGDPFFNTTLQGGSRDTANYSYLWTADTNGVAINNPLGIADLTNPYPQTITQAVPFDVNYTLTATHKFAPVHSCSGSVEIFSTNIALPSSNTRDTITCVGNSVPIGGFATAGWSAEWRAIQGTIDQLNNEALFDPIFTPTSAGNFAYEVTITDDVSGCAIKDTAYIEVIEVVANAGDDISVCDQAIVQIGTTAIPGLLYNWEPVSVSDPTMAQPIDTIYANTQFRLLVTDALGACPQRDTIDIAVVSPPIFDAGADVTVCEGGSIQIGNAPNAGQYYLWSPTTGLEDATISNPIIDASFLTTGSHVYSVTITNDNPGCVSVEQVTINVLPAEFIDAGVDAIVCKGETLQIGNALNSGTIQWSPSDYLDNATLAQPTITMPLTGVTEPLSYTITITYPSGCQQQEEIIITPTMAVADAGSNQTQCEGESINIGVASQAGYTYVWTPTTGLQNPNASTTTAAPNATTTYTLTATSPEGCEATDMVMINYQAVPIDAGPDVVFCPSDGAVSIGTAGQGAYTYAWTPAAGLSDPGIAMPTATVNTATAYVLNVTHIATGCERKDTVLVSPESNVDLGNDFAICPGEEITIGIVDPLDGTTFSWSPGGQTTSNITVSPTATTTYTLTTLKAGCTISDQVKVSLRTAPIAAAGNATVICQDACVQIGANPIFGLSYAWSPATGLSDASIANPIACPDVTTTYTLTVVENITGCTASSIVAVAVSPTPAPMANAGLDQSICPGESTIIGANTETTASYSWSPTAYLNTPYIAQPTFTPPSALAPSTFTYYLTMTDNDTGCYKKDTVVIDLERQPTAPSVNDVSLCAGSAVELCPDCSSITGHTYQWSPANTIEDPTKLNAIAHPIATSFYTLVITDTATSCTNTVFVEANVTTDPLPSVDAGIDQVICEGNSAIVGGTDTGVSYEWGPANLVGYMSPNNTSSQITFTPPNIDTYTLELTATAINGCTNRDEVTIISRKEAIADAGMNQFICDAALVMTGIPANVGIGTWTHESGPGNPSITDSHNANTPIGNLEPGIHTFKWTITGSDICNDGVFDYVTLIYEDPTVNIFKNICQPNRENYDVLFLIEEGDLYEVNEGIIGSSNQYTAISSIDLNTQLQIVAITNGNCLDTTLIAAPICPDCFSNQCLPIQVTIKRGNGG